MLLYKALDELEITETINEFTEIHKSLNKASKLYCSS